MCTWPAALNGCASHPALAHCCFRLNIAQGPVVSWQQSVRGWGNCSPACMSLMGTQPLLSVIRRTCQPPCMTPQPGSPRCVCRLSIVESLAWQNGSRVYELMHQVAACPAVASLMQAFLRETGELAEAMAAHCCKTLSADLPELQARASFVQDCQSTVASLRLIVTSKLSKPWSDSGLLLASSCHSLCNRCWSCAH